MKNTLRARPALVLVVGLALLLALPTWSVAASVITKEELKPLLGDSNLVILDVRLGRDWKSSEFKIKGAVRAAPLDYDMLAQKYGKDKTYVLYCA